MSKIDNIAREFRTINFYFNFRDENVTMLH